MRLCGHHNLCSRKAFTIVEMLVVTGVIALLIAVLVPALSGGLRSASMAKSMNKLKQIHTWLSNYSSENREYIVPSQFDYTASAAAYAVKVRSDADLPGAERYKGTWTDILWVYSGLGQQQVMMDQSQPANTDKYMFDSPDKAAYDNDPDIDSPFRSSESNTRDYGAGNGIPTPFGPPFGNTTVGGATESGLPGYFAANNFFNSTTGNWYVTGQIKTTDRSLYAVDSVAGETIDPDPAVNGPWDNPTVDGASAAAAPNQQVDFRYNGTCLMLMLDGHSEPQSPFRDLWELEGYVSSGSGQQIQGRNVRVSQLTRSGLPIGP
jgi:type II secretory pathway pseudopilin PulG